MKRHLALLQLIPTPMGGLGLGMASLGTAWALFLPQWGGLFKAVLCSLGAVALIMVMTKLLFFPKLLKQDLECNVTSSVMPTATMGTMVVAAWIASFAHAVGQAMWLIAIVLHMLLLVAFTWHQARVYTMSRIVPSWFVPPIGIVVACVTSPGMGYEALVHVLLWFGIVCYVLMLPLMLYRLMFAEQIPVSALPTLAIMAAPASLTLAGYLTVIDQPQFAVVATLLQLALFMTGLGYVALIRLLRMPFSPGYAAMTFPLVIGAIALLKLRQSAEDLFQPELVEAINWLAKIELAVATLVVSFVFWKYLKHIGHEVVLKEFRALH